MSFISTFECRLLAVKKLLEYCDAMVIKMQTCKSTKEEKMMRNRDSNIRESWIVIFIIVMAISCLTCTAFAAGGDVLWQYGDTPKTGKQEAASMIVDSAGNAIIVGYSGESGNDDYYTVKIKADGTGVLWSTTYDKSGGNDYATAVAVDSNDDVIVTGYAWNGSNYDFHTIKYSSIDGAVLWQHNFNGAVNGNDYATAITVDALDNIYVGGNSQDGSGIDDFMVLKYASHGITPLWQKNYNGPANGHDRVKSITAGVDGIAVTGESQNATPDFDAVTVKYGFDSSLVLEKRKTVSGNDKGIAVRMDSSGHVIMTAITYNGSNKDIYIVKYNGTTGAEMWQDTYNSGGDDEPADLYVDSSDDAYITGYKYSATNGNDIYTAKYNGATGANPWNDSFNSSNGNSDKGVCLHGDDSGSLFVVGNTYDDAAGNYNFQTLKYAKASGNRLWQKSYNGTAGKDDRVVAVGVTASGAPITGGWSDQWTAGASDYDYYAIKYDPGMLNPPTGLNVSAVSASQIDLSWTDNSSNEDGFKIERKTGEEGAWSEITAVGANVTAYSNTGLTADTKYYYRVKSYNAGDGDSYYSNEAYAVTTIVSFTAPATTYVYNSPDNADDYVKDIAAGPDNAPVATGYSYSAAGQFDYLTVKLNKDTLAGTWSARYDSDQNDLDIGKTVVVDGNNNVVVSGYSYMFSIESGGNTNDIYTIKYPSTGTPETWNDQYNGPAGDDDRSSVVDVSTDGSNNYVVVGYGRNEDWNDDIYVIKYLSNGTRAWAATPYDGGVIGHDYPAAVTFDPSGNIIVAGYTSNGTDYDYFVRKYNGSTGAPMWTDIYNIAGTGNDYASSIAVDASGNIYVTGDAVTASGNEDFYTIKYNGTTGARMWEKSFNGLGDGTDEAISVKVDPVNGDVIVAGRHYVDAGNNDFHIIRYDTDGNVVWQRTLDRPSNDDVVMDMAIDKSGNVYVVGYTDSGSFSDAIAVQYDYNGSFLRGRIYAGAAGKNDVASSATVNGFGRAYVGGYATNASNNADYLVFVVEDELQAPIPVQASPSFTTVSLTWTDNTVSEDGFSIERKTGDCTSGHPWTAVYTAAANTTSYNDTLLNTGSDYCYRIRSYKYPDDYSRWIETSATTLVPQAPSGLSASPVNTTRINLSWTDNTSGETGFKIERCAGAGCSDFSEIDTAAANATSYSDLAACNSTNYTYHVVAYKTGEWSTDASNTSSATTTTPSAPTVLLATRATEVQINLSWTDNTSDETGFKIERCSGSGCADFAEIATVGSNITSYNNSGLSYSTDYSYRVRAYKTAACGWDTAYTNTASASTTITAPGSLLASTVNTTQINLSWTDTSGSETGFKIERCEGVGCSSFTQIDTAGANATSYSDTSVCENITYRYRVRAYKDTTWDSGYSNESETATSTKLAPTVLLAIRASEVQIDLSWTDNTSDETGFKIERCTGSGCADFAEIATVGSNITSYNNSGLSYSTDYSYRVRAYKTAVCGWDTAYTNTASASTTITAPGSLLASTVNTTQINLSWTDTSGSETGFKIERCEGVGCSSFAQIDTAGTNATSYSDTSGCENVAYRYRVRAYNGATWDSGYSNESETATSAKAAPTVLNATRASEVQINLSWTDNTSDETGFKIERCTGTGCSSFTEIATVGSGVTSYNDTSLGSMLTFNYRVRAYKTAACAWNSEYSNETEAETTVAPPSALNTTASVGTVCNDIRMTDSDGSSLIDFWLESGCNSTSTALWVEVPSIPTGDKTIYYYYDSPGVPSVSSGDNTFEFFDNFRGTTIDSTKWVEIDPNGSIAQNDDLILNDVSDAWDKALISQQTFSRASDKKIYMKILMGPDTAGNNNMMVGWESNQTANPSYNQLVYGFYWNNTAIDAYEYGNNRSGSGSYSWNTEYEMKIELKSSGANYYVKGGAYSDWSLRYNSTAYSDATMRVAFTQYSHQAYVHLITVMKYAATEPTTSLGQAEYGSYLIGADTFSARMPVTVSNTGSALSDHQVALNVDTTTLVYDRIDLSWTDNSASETEFRIERCAGAGCSDFAQIATVGADVSAYTDNTVDISTTYCYRIKAAKAAEWESNPSEASCATTSGRNTPTGLSATAIDENQVDLTWTDNTTDESGFKVERCAGAGCSDFTEIAVVAANAGTYSDTSACNGTDYTYRVKAYNAGSWSSGPAEASVTTPTPEIPGDFNAAGASEVIINLSWTDNSINETGFKIERCEGEGCSDFAEIADVGNNETSFSDTNLTPSTTYEYRIKSYSFATCPWETEYAAATGNTLSPPPPTGLSASVANTTQINLTWTDNTDSETGFRLQRCEGTGCSSFVDLTTLAPDVTSHSDTGVCNTTAYRYRIRAEKNDGPVWNSSWSTPDEASTPAISAPTGLTATRATEVQINLSWTDNTGDETGFKIERCAGAGCSDFAEIATVGSNVTTYNNTGLDYSTDYTYRVRAYKTASCGWETGYTNESSASTTITAPGGFAATTVNTTQINLTWTDTSGSETGFKIERCEGAGCSGFAEIGTAGANVTSYSDTSVCENTTYRYRVKAYKDLEWESGYSGESERTTNAKQSPTVLNATRITEVQINLSWTDNTGDETGFKIERCSGAGCSDFTQIATVGSNVTSYNNTGLTYSTDYTYRVRAYKTATCVWDTSYTNEASASTSIMVPGGFTATTVNTTQINLSWTDNTASETGFKIERCSGAGCSDFAQITTTGANVTSYSDSSVCNTTDYNYRVRAYKSGEWDSGYSSEDSALTSALTAPSGLNASMVSYTQINLSWTDNMSEETGFKVERCAGSGCSDFAQTGTTGASVTSYSDTTVSPSTTYCYRVRTYKTASCGWDSSYSNESCEASLPAIPTTLTATALNAFKIRLDWTDNAADEDGYEIEVKLWNGEYIKVTEVGADVTAYTDTESLEPAKQYTYRIRAFRGSDYSPYSGEASDTTPAWQEGDDTCRE